MVFPTRQLFRLVACLLSLLSSSSIPSQIDAFDIPSSSRSGVRLVTAERPYSSSLTTRGGSALSSNDEAGRDRSLSELKDFTGEAAGLFGNIRIPAALFAGASAGAAFALPVTMGSESLKLGLVKRIYALLMMSALSSQVVAVVVSTLVLSKLATSTHLPLAPSLTAFLQSHWDLEFIAVRWHFLSGILFFLVGIGLRAWITIACPVIAKAALGIILSSTLLCIAFVQDDVSSPDIWLDGFFQMPFRYGSLLAKRSWKRGTTNPVFALSLLATLTTMIYTLGKGRHIIRWLASNATI